MHLLVLSGIPGAGKSHFGRWLESTHGYIHLDVEKEGLLASYHLTDAWNSCFASLVLPDVSSFIKSLHHLGQRLVVNWGFPPQRLNVVQRFKAAGLEPWWFDADRDAARRAYEARGDFSIQFFEIQMAAIREQWPNIEATFRPNIITTLMPDDSRLPVEAIYKVMWGAKKEAGLITRSN